MLRYYTAGESHGKCLIAFLEGMPAGLELSEGDINQELARRQGVHLLGAYQGYAGRGERMRSIEKDRVSIVAGVRQGETIGSPLCLLIENKDWHPEFSGLPLTRPRPGHADLSGVLKYAREDIRDILERASARETAARVAVGAVCKKLLKEFSIETLSHTVSIGGVKTEKLNFRGETNVDNLRQRIDSSPVRTLDKKAEGLMLKKIEEAKNKGDTLGGIFAVIIHNVPVGLGSYIQWDLRLDGRLAQALMSIPGVKGVEIGGGFDLSGKFGSQVHDEIFYNSKTGFFRQTNNAGGLEGGISNGEDIVLKAVIKPISSLPKPLRSVDIKTKKSTTAEVVRGDICVVPVAGVVGEAMGALEIGRAMRDKFGGDSLEEMKRNFSGYLQRLKRR